jgi:hypothetical protein
LNGWPAEEALHPDGGGWRGSRTGPVKKDSKISFFFDKYCAGPKIL